MKFKKFFKLRFQAFLLSEKVFIDNSLKTVYKIRKNCQGSKRVNIFQNITIYGKC